MSKYTTGEMAQLCQVTVRTVQYYDTRGIKALKEIEQLSVESIGDVAYTMENRDKLKRMYRLFIIT